MLSRYKKTIETIRYIPSDEITLSQLAKQILKNPVKQGYLTFSNALQLNDVYNLQVSFSRWDDYLLALTPKPLIEQMNIFALREAKVPRTTAVRFNGY